MGGKPKRKGPPKRAFRERMLDRDVLKVEYYPKNLFDDAKGRPCRQQGATAKCDKGDELEADIERKMNKVSLATLWVDPKERLVAIMLVQRYPGSTVAAAFQPLVYQALVK